MCGLLDLFSATESESAMIRVDSAACRQHALSAAIETSYSSFSETNAPTIPQQPDSKYSMGKPHLFRHFRFILQSPNCFFDGSGLVRSRHVVAWAFWVSFDHSISRHDCSSEGRVNREREE